MNGEITKEEYHNLMRSVVRVQCKREKSKPDIDTLRVRTPSIDGREWSNISVRSIDGSQLTWSTKISQEKCFIRGKKVF